MEWWQWILTAGVAGLAGAIVVVTPAIIKLLTAKASVMTNFHELVVKELTTEIARMTVRLDAKGAEERALHVQLLACEKRSSAAEAREESMRVGVMRGIEGVHVLVNSQKTELEEHVKRLAAEAAELKNEIASLKEAAIIMGKKGE